jgi:hypothetical protein
MDGAGLLARLRQHQRLVIERRNPRDIKVFDDELRLAIADFCHPCNGWVRERATIEDLYPLRRIDEASTAICLGFKLPDGTIVYGDDRPRACR